MTAVRAADEAHVRRFIARLEQATRAKAMVDSGPTELQLARLDQGALDLVLGGFAEDSPWLDDSRSGFGGPIRWQRRSFQ